MSTLMKKADHIPEGKSGDWEIQKYEITEQQAKMHQMRCAFQGSSRGVRAGTYTKLVQKNGTGGSLWMSDTPAELSDLYEVIYEVHGIVLITGLGLGIVTESILRRDKVEKVIVLEKSRDVLNLVEPYMSKDDRLQIIHADAFKWHPGDVRFNIVWHDIWTTYHKDTHEESKTLHRRYGRWLQKPHWQGSWGRSLWQSGSKW